jgi:hypothetical protein
MSEHKGKGTLMEAKNKHKELADDVVEDDENKRRRENTEAARRDADASFKIFKDGLKKLQKP